MQYPGPVRGNYATVSPSHGACPTRNETDAFDLYDVASYSVSASWRVEA